jgi:hypothetical protein
MVSGQGECLTVPDISLAFAGALGDSAPCNLVVDRRSAVRTGPPPVAPKRAAPVTQQRKSQTVAHRRLIRECKP